jgi:hypothetical protein
MTLHLPRLPFAVDPLIAEAKRRMRQRRLFVALVAILVTTGAGGITLALRSPFTTRGTPRGTPAPSTASGSGGGLLSTVGTIPFPVFEAVHGRVVGWAKTGHDWLAVYVDKPGVGWCGLGHDSWRIALVETKAVPVQIVADRRIGAAECGNALSWVRAGRFTDGLHREVAFMLWTTPAIGATAYIYRVAANRLRLLATIHGDRVNLARGRAVVGFENRGRSAHGELKDTYRFLDGRYRLVRRR